MSSKLYVHDRVVMVDRYAARAVCTCPKVQPSWFDGMTGKVTQVTPYVMVHIDGERLPLRFDERDFDKADDALSSPNMTGAE